MKSNDGIDMVQEFTTSDLTDVENDGEEECGTEESTGTASVLRLTTHVERRGLKRGYTAMCVDHAQPERRLRSRIHQQFELLRAAVPNLCTDERASILTGAYEYIERLQREEAELRCELGLESWCEFEAELSCCEDEGSCSSCREFLEESAVDNDSSVAGCSKSLDLFQSYESNSSQPTSVEVLRTEAGLRIHIECGMRPGLLLAIMQLLESSGLAVEEASVECVERLVFDGVGLEDVEEGGESSNMTLVSAEFLRASLRSLIDDQRRGSAGL